MSRWTLPPTTFRRAPLTAEDARRLATRKARSYEEVVQERVLPAFFAAVRRASSQGRTEMTWILPPVAKADEMPHLLSIFLQRLAAYHYAVEEDAREPAKLHIRWGGLIGKK